MPVMGTCTNSSIGYGKDQCNLPGPGSSSSPLPCGLPNRRIITRSWAPTMKNPEAKKTTTSTNITTLTTAKLLRRASARACEPGSAGVGPGRLISSGGGGISSAMGFSLLRAREIRRAASGNGRLRRGGRRAQQVGGNPPQQVERRRVAVEHQRSLVFQRVLQRVQAENELGQLRLLLEDRQ